MDIRGDAKKIVQMLLTAAVEQGNLRINFPIEFDKIAQELELKNAKYCRLCFMYLSDKGLIEPNRAAGCIQLHASAVDFLADA